MVKHIVGEVKVNHLLSVMVPYFHITMVNVELEGEGGVWGWRLGQ